MVIPAPVIGFLCLIGCGTVFSVVPQGLYQLLAINDLSEFQRMINSSLGMRKLLSDPMEDLTVFAPTNEAVMRWKASNRQNIMNSNILENHIALGGYNQAKLLEIAQAADKFERRLLSGFRNSPLWIRYFPANPAVERPVNKLFVNDALIMREQPIEAGQQFLYIVDAVLAPTGSLVSAQTFLDDPSAQVHSDLALEYLQEAVNKLAHFSTLGNTASVFTFFLPNNAAFTSLKSRDVMDESVLKGHIIFDNIVFLGSSEDALLDIHSHLPANRRTIPAFDSLLTNDGSGQESYLGFPNSSNQRQVYSLVTKPDKYLRGRVYGNIVKANIPVANGVIHIIDRLLLVVEDDAKEILDSRRDFSKFRELLGFADPKFAERLTNESDLTVFIPSNAALASLPGDKASRLRQDRQLLDQILNLHIISRKLLLEEVTNITTVLTPVGQRLTFKILKINGGNQKGISVEGEGVVATVMEPDLAATNAVIHVIDQVLGVPFLNALERLRKEPTLSQTYKGFTQTKELNSALSSPSANCTVFAPSDLAWRSMNELDRNSILSNPALLSRILRRHLVEGRRMDTVRLRKEDRYTTTPGDVVIKKGHNLGDTVLSWKGHSAKIIVFDIGAINGIIHIIDQVLFDREIDFSSGDYSLHACIPSRLLFLFFFVIQLICPPLLVS